MTCLKKSRIIQYTLLDNARFINRFISASRKEFEFRIKPNFKKKYSDGNQISNLRKKTLKNFKLKLFKN